MGEEEKLRAELKQRDDEWKVTLMRRLEENTKITYDTHNALKLHLANYKATEASVKKHEIILNGDPYDSDKKGVVRKLDETAEIAKTTKSTLGKIAVGIWSFIIMMIPILYNAIKEAFRGHPK